jgi:hypothetical protein
VAFAAGFFAPVEIRVKVSFPTPLTNRRLIWVPQAAHASRDPDLDFLRRETNRVLLNGDSILLLHARPHDPLSSDKLADLLNELRHTHHNAALDTSLDMSPQDSKSILAILEEWFGREFLSPLPTVDTVQELCGDSRLVCVSSVQESSFKTVFKDLGISRDQFRDIGVELRIAKEHQLLAELAKIDQPRGPLLYASHGFSKRLPEGVRAEFAGQMFTAGSALDSTLAFIERLRTEAQRRDLADAARTQRILMPVSPFQSDALVIAPQFRPCRMVAGDFYDWVYSPDGQLVIALGDISGKGSAAALIAAQAQAVIRIAAQSEKSPSAVARLVDEQISSTERYLEFFCGFFDAETRELRYFYAGHTPPVLRRFDGTIERLQVTGTCPGMHARGLPTEFEHASVVLQTGDRLLVFTDGISEAEGHSDVIAALQASMSLPGCEAAEAVIQDAEKRVGSFEDDATLLLLCLL